jgi:hypothetical protein
MSLYPGAPQKVKDQIGNVVKDPTTGKEIYALDDKALEQSMAKAIEDAMADVFEKVNGTPLPASGQEDRRVLFVALSRGILKYLQDHQKTIVATQDQGNHAHGVDLRVTMETHTDHSS